MKACEAFGLVTWVFCSVAFGHVSALASPAQTTTSFISNLSDVHGVMKGISYAPVPIKIMGEPFPNDDFMSPAFGPLWHEAGRDDLGIIQKLGANTIRLYGNDPRFDHQQFLQAADAQGLHVIVGMSNYPFTDAPNACSKSNWDCYEQLKAQYADNLRSGFLLENRSYHGALSQVIIINEADYKAPGLSKPKLFCKAIISALDGMLSAEKEAQVRGNLVKFTATFSFGVCQQCSKYNTRPALGQMYDLRAAMLDPSTVGYTPKNDLRAAYEGRFHHSFNAQSPAYVVQAEFLKVYSAEFREPFFIGEYHAPMVPQTSDLVAIMKLAEDPSNQFFGIFFFEFQKSYWKGGSELAFGMLGLGTLPLMDFNANGVKYTAWCLDDEVPDPNQNNTTLVQAVTQVYGGEGYDFTEACLFDPAKVPVTEAGYNLILAQKSTTRMMAFVARLVGHLGGLVKDKTGLMEFTAGYSGEAGPLAGDFATMVGTLQETHPNWAHWEVASAACVVDHSGLPPEWTAPALGEALDYACTNMRTFNCADVPPQCNGTLYTRADYVFSIYFDDVVAGADPLKNCFFNGSAQYAPRETYKSWDSSCVITRDPGSTALTQDGYNAVLETRDSDKVAKLIKRVLWEQFQENVRDTDDLKQFARNKSHNLLPRSFEQLLMVLRKVPWTCDGETHRTCSAGSKGANPWIWLGLATAIGVVSIVLLYFIWDRRRRHKQRRSALLVPEGSRSLQNLP